MGDYRDGQISKARAPDTNYSPATEINNTKMVLLPNFVENRENLHLAT